MKNFDGQRVSKIAKELMESPEHNRMTNVAYGDLNLLHDIFDKAELKLKNKHPLNKHQAVLNALDRESKRSDAIFEKKFFRAYKGLARIFCLKTKTTKTE